MRSVLFTVAARKDLRRLPDEIRRQFEIKLVRYAENGTGDVRKLQGREGARLRSGDYRAIFVETEIAIEVRAVRHRRDIYR